MFTITAGVNFGGVEGFKGVHLVRPTSPAPPCLVLATLKPRNMVFGSDTMEPR